MARTNKKWIRVYLDGVDISGYIRDAGKLSELAPIIPDMTVTDMVKNGLVGQTILSCGPINAVLDNDGAAYPAGLYASFNQAGGTHTLAVAVGTLAAPAIGDMCFFNGMNETAFQVLDNGKGFISVHINDDKTPPGTWNTYEDGFGWVVHPLATETGVNAANQTVDMGGYLSSKGGLWCYHLMTSLGSGTVVLKLQQSASGTGGWSDVTGATSPALTTPNATGLSGIVALAPSTNVDRYLRWQLVFSGCTSATFFTAFIRQT